MEDEQKKDATALFDKFSLFEFRNQSERAKYEMETEVDKSQPKIKENYEGFEFPRKFSLNFQKLVREKFKTTLTPTKNSYQVLTDDSDSEGEDDIGKKI